MGRGRDPRLCKPHPYTPFTHPQPHPTCVSLPHSLSLFFSHSLMPRWTLSEAFDTHGRSVQGGGVGLGSLWQLLEKGVETFLPTPTLPHHLPPMNGALPLPLNIYSGERAYLTNNFPGFQSYATATALREDEKKKHNNFFFHYEKVCRKTSGREGRGERKLLVFPLTPPPLKLSPRANPTRHALYLVSAWLTYLKHNNWFNTL